MNRKWMGFIAMTTIVMMLAAGCTSSETKESAPAGNQTAQQQTAQEQSGTVQESENAPAADTKQKNNGYSAEPAMTIDAEKAYTAIMETSLGTIEIELMPKIAPHAVNSLVFLSGEGYFDNLTFHRVVKDFVLQTGDPLGNGTGGPGYSFVDELGSGISYDPGIVAMANSGPNTNGSQFFICSGESCKGLNNMPNYTIFGKVVKGMDVVSMINNVEVDYAPSGELSLPKQPVTIKSMKIAIAE